MGRLISALADNKQLAVCAALFAWWRAELAQLIPVRLKHWLATDEAITRILLDKHRTQIICQTSNNKEQHSVAIDGTISTMADDENFIRQIKNTVSGPVILELSSALILERIIELPEAARHSYRNIISLQTEKYFPLSLQEIYFDGFPQQQDSRKKHFSLHLAMVKKTYTDPLIAVLKSKGAWVLSIKAKSAYTNLPSYKFADFAVQHKSHEQKALAASLVLGLGLLCILLTSVHYKLAQRHQYLSTSVKMLSQEAREIQSMQTQINEAQQQKKLYQQKISQTTLVDLLARLSQLLPEDTWIYEYSQRKTHHIISGKTANASQLLQIMDQDPLFSNLSNSSTITEQGADRERFTLSFDVPNCLGDCQ